MTTAACDVVSDHVTDGAMRLGIPVPVLFRRAAEAQSFTNYDEVATRWYNLWKRSGYYGLPPVVKDYVLAVNNGEFAHHPH